MGRETPMAYLNVAGVIKRFKRSYISAVRRVASPGIEKRGQKPKISPQPIHTSSVRERTLDSCYGVFSSF